MRSNIVFVVLLGLLALFAGAIVKRRLTGEAEILPEVKAPPSASVAAISAPPSASASASAAIPDAPKFARTLRVAALGFDLLTPGIIENDGLELNSNSSFGKAKLPLELKLAKTSSDIESMLARGGGDAQGADVAVLPLPEFAAAYPRLRALKPLAFYVLGFSHGREQVISHHPNLTAAFSKKPVAVAWEPGSSAASLGLFALQLANYSARDVHVVTGEERPALRAVDSSKAKASDDNVLLSTDSASRLIPIVAVAPAGLVANHPEALTTLIKGWMEGQKKAAADVTSAVRRVAKIKDAPEPLWLLNRLGELDSVSVRENAELFGLAGRSALTAEALFMRAYELWQNAKTVTQAPPEAAPIESSIVAFLVRSEPELTKPTRPAPDGRPRPQGNKAFLTEVTSKTEQELATELALLGAIFPRSTLRITVHKKELGPTSTLIETAVARFDLARERLEAAKLKAVGSASATIEIVSP